MPSLKQQLYALLLLIGIAALLIFVDAVVNPQRQSAAVLAVSDVDTYYSPFGDAPGTYNVDTKGNYTGPKLSGCAAEGGLPVSSCRPPGPQSQGGRDGTQCHAMAGDSLFIDGICTDGCCRGTVWTSGADAANAGLTGGSGIGGLFQSAFSALTQFFGGAGTGGSGSGSPSNPAYVTLYPTVQSGDGLLQFDATTPEGTLGGGSDLLFGSADDSDVADFLSTPVATEQIPKEGDLGAPAGNAPQTGEASKGDSVTTAYEYLKSLSEPASSDGQNVDSGLPQEDDFTQDYFGSGLNNSEEEPFSDNSLSQANLELQGREVLGRNQDFETQHLTDEERQRIENYRSASIARSPDFGTNPLGNDRFDVELPPAEPEPPSWWQEFVLRVISFFDFRGS